MRTSITLVAAGLALAALSACSSEPQQAGTAASSGPAKDSKIAVAANDTECKVAVNEVNAGTSTFAITNAGSKVTEFYVYAPGDRVMGEVENIVPGLTRDVIVELPAGTYEAACKPGMIGKGIRNPLTVSGEHTPLTDDAKLADATASYKRYIKSQSDTLLVKTQEFVDAVKAGDIDKAKALFPVARTYWERIEPVAEIFGDLDPAIDAREADLEEGQEWTGYHKIEKDLWIEKDVSKDGPIADKLMTDVKTIVDKSNTAELSPSSWPTAPRSCSTRWPPGRSPARRTPGRTPTCGTSTPTCRDPRPPSSRCARCWRSAPPTWSRRSTRSSPPPRTRWARTRRATAGSCTTSCPRMS